MIFTCLLHMRQNSFFDFFQFLCTHGIDLSDSKPRIIHRKLLEIQE